MILFIIAVLCFSLLLGCSTEYTKGWSWGVLTEDGDMEAHKFIWTKRESRINDILLSPKNKHEVCKESHYTDPYTKIEYCFPDGFTGINKHNMHHYLVVR